VSDSPSKIKGFGISFGTGKSASATPEEPGSRGPLRIVVVSGLAAGPDYTTRAAPSTDPIAVDKLSFERLMMQVAPAFAIELRDPFAPEGPPLRVDLKWPELKSLRPDGIVEQVSALRGLVEARKIVTQVRDRKLSAEDARAQLARMLPNAAWADALTSEVTTRPASEAPARKAAPAAAAPKATKASALDALLDKVDVDGDTPKGDGESGEGGGAVNEPAGLSALVAMVARGGKPGGARGPQALVGSALEKTERAFGQILGAILLHPEVRRLERAWRGLRLLVEASDSRAGVEIDVVVAQKGAVEDAIRSFAEPTGAQAQRAPVDVFLVDHDVDASLEGTTLLSAWAAAARDMHAPIVVNGDVSILGLTAMDELPKASRRLAGYDDPRPADAKAAGANEATRWATVAMNGPMLRAAYTPSTSRLREIPFAEAAKDRKSHVFGGAAMAIGVLCAKSYAKTGWPCAIVGPVDGIVENLPVHEIEDAGHTAAIPLEVICGDDVVKEAARAGVALFTCAPNHDAAVLARAPMFHKKGQPAPTVTLGDQLFVGRFANAVQQVAAAIPSDVPAKAGAEAAEIALAELFANVGHAAPEVRARINGGRLEVTVRPRRFAGVSIEEFGLAAPLGV
jgi:type VI secretion system ImpB/VipA family protein